MVLVPLTQNQFDALVCFSIDIGIDNFEKSTLLMKLNNNDYNCVSSQMIRLQHCHNIYKIKAESELFRTGIVLLENENGNS